MADKEYKLGKVTLDVELQELLNIVSKLGTTNSISDRPSNYVTEGEDLRKAWFKHMFISIEKLNDLIETVRRVDIVDLRSDFKDDLDKFDLKLEKLRGNFNELSNTLSNIKGKLSVWAILAGCIGSGIGMLALYILKLILSSLGTN